ncbi:hypothetical protein AKJ40_02585 [candidate division MSBL1 archaeon SCGC-AAA259M10]|uniref:Thymidylate synthase/dCMP hydroxymethylase domain-containing protein n=4 Tax=candidate division MSBL1 TaxID=215777 RepID=A0A133UPV0_9EURY|nr:hypothetical protein AKJ61_03120 [candidate division MSBL1 archaeon SCGC-AAA259B11]KXA93654.1 hypothetical protein AKJ66_01475 [candidate division MSBL1 archaeon SCGC-AAA259E22]KXA96183.1 hypothetical protein AKJ38_03735 [candidate division MSBL1 archaeon SCGC-AAA259I14]KXA99704.1 hypothetical protein AKJ40_02585 [candidate division MSBL1 archaeon SCGC-AAA259M10]
MRKIKARNLPEVWFKANKEILENGVEYKVGRGSEETLTKKIAVALEITHPEERPLVDDKAPVSDLNRYTLENLFIKDEQSYDYTYGSRLRKDYDQIERVIEKFKEEPKDRQNIMVTRRPEDLDIENPPCLTVVDLEILENKLINYSYWRSWDAYAGLPSNLGGMQLLMEFMAKEIGVGTGKMVAFSKNLHLYERQFKFVEDLISGSSDWREIMMG